MTKHIFLFLLTISLAGCTKQKSTTTAVKSTNAAAIVEVSGGKQVGGIGRPLEQPIVVQVNDASGTAVQGATVILRLPWGASAEPRSGETDSSGQFTSVVSAPGISGHFEVAATATDAKGKAIDLKLDEIALGYEQELGRQVNLQYCVRCHDPESTPERVSNMDNLNPKPHAFTEGDFLNKISDSDLALVIARGGPALNKSGAMPPYGSTLSKTEIQALVSYIRAIADPPYKHSGTIYAEK